MRHGQRPGPCAQGHLPRAERALPGHAYISPPDYPRNTASFAKMEGPLTPSQKHTILGPRSEDAPVQTRLRVPSELVARLAVASPSRPTGRGWKAQTRTPGASGLCRPRAGADLACRGALAPLVTGPERDSPRVGRRRLDRPGLRRDARRAPGRGPRRHPSALGPGRSDETLRSPCQHRTDPARLDHRCGSNAAELAEQ